MSAITSMKNNQPEYREKDDDDIVDIQSLPNEIMGEIFQYLPVQNPINAVCRRWQSLSNHYFSRKLHQLSSSGVLSELSLEFPRNMPPKNQVLLVVSILNKLSVDNHKQETFNSLNNPENEILATAWLAAQPDGIELRNHLRLHMSTMSRNELESLIESAPEQVEEEVSRGRRCLLQKVSSVDVTSLSDEKVKEALRIFLHSEAKRKVFDLNFCFQSLRLIPPEIFSLKNLKALNFSGNNLLLIPSGITRLRKLKNLTLIGNGEIVLNESLRDTRIRELWLSGCALGNLPNCIGEMTHLEQLDISGNFLQTLPEKICSLPNLKTLRGLERANNPLENISLKVATFLKEKFPEQSQTIIESYESEHGLIQIQKKKSFSIFGCLAGIVVLYLLCMYSATLLDNESL